MNADCSPGAAPNTAPSVDLADASAASAGQRPEKEQRRTTQSRTEGRARHGASSKEAGGSPSDTAAIIRACLAHLRVASLERLVREVTRVRPSTTRADVMAILEKASDGVVWFGRSILALTTRPAERAPRSGASARVSAASPGAPGGSSAVAHAPEEEEHS